MSTDEQGFWARSAGRRLSRRAAVAGSAIIAGSAALAACAGKKAPRGQNNAASSASSGGKPVYGGTLNWFTDSNPTGLDPHKNARVTTMRMIGGVQSRLFMYKTGLDPKVCESHDVEGDLALTGESVDALTWTFKLRPDARFSDTPPVNGHAVEAEDVKATFVRALSTPENANAGALSMVNKDQIETPARDTVVFRLNYPYAAFTHTLASGSYPWIFPREALAGAYDPNKTVIGSGPFLLDSWAPDVAAVYKRNPDWYQKGQPYIDGVKFAVIPDPGAQAAQFTGGNLDILTAFLDSDLAQLKRNNPRASQITGAPAVSASFVFGQLGDPSSAWSDIRVRQAVSMAIDRDALAKIVAPNGGEKQTAVGVAYGKWALHPQDFPPEIAKYSKYDPAESRKLLDAAGRTGMPFKFIYTNNFYGPRFNTTAETINGMLSSAGFKTNLLTIDYIREWVAGGKGIRYGAAPNDAIVYGITSGFDDADEVIFNYFDSASSLRNTALKDPKLDAMVSKYRSILNEDERVRAEIETQKYLASQLYLVDGMTTPFTYWLVQPWVANVNYGISYGTFTETYARLWLNKPGT